MFSTRSVRASSLRSPARRRTRRLASAGAILLAAVSGCAHQNEQPRTEPVNTTMVIDEPTQRRDWPQSAAQFPSGTSEAGPTRFPRQLPDSAGESASVLDPLLFLGQVVILPFTYITQGPDAKQDAPGVLYDPTYTGVPPLPPDSGSASDGNGAATPTGTDVGTGTDTETGSPADVATPSGEGDKSGVSTPRENRTTPEDGRTTPDNNTGTGTGTRTPANPADELPVPGTPATPGRDTGSNQDRGSRGGTVVPRNPPSGGGSPGAGGGSGGGGGG